MDVLDVLRLAEERGGKDRRQAISRLLKSARDLGCTFQTGGGKRGGFNVRYGANSYSILDVTTDGTVFVHINPDSALALSTEERASRNAFLAGLDGLTMKNADVQNYGQVTELIEAIPEASVDALLRFALDQIRADLQLSP